MDHSVSLAKVASHSTLRLSTIPVQTTGIPGNLSLLYLHIHLLFGADLVQR